MALFDPMRAHLNISYGIQFYLVVETAANRLVLHQNQRLKNKYQGFEIGMYKLLFISVFFRMLKM